jgi:hypothetical protein
MWWVHGGEQSDDRWHEVATRLIADTALHGVRQFHGCY